MAIIGLGAIGSALADRLASFGTYLLGVRAHPSRGGHPAMREVAGPDQLHDVLGQADAVICCAMYDGSNDQMFDEAAFNAMKPGAIFVNVARGALVDETALLAALKSGQVAGAGLDVHAVEPADPHSPLLKHRRVLATPHVGGLTREMFYGTAAVFADNVQRWAAGEPLLWAANSPVSPRHRQGIGGGGAAARR